MDTRTFRDIYKSLNEVDQATLRDLVSRYAMVADSTIRCWITLKRRPSALAQVNIVKALRKIGIRSDARFLFPR